MPQLLIIYDPTDLMQINHSYGTPAHLQVKHASLSVPHDMTAWRRTEMSVRLAQMLLEQLAPPPDTSNVPLRLHIEPNCGQGVMFLGFRGPDGQQCSVYNDPNRREQVAQPIISSDQGCFREVWVPENAVPILTVPPQCRSRP